MRATLLALALLFVIATAAAGGVDAAVDYANEHWDCANVGCTQKVARGQFQPGYECAEFVARSLANGGLVKGISPNAPQSSYGNHDGYDLLSVVPLHDYLKKVGFKDAGKVSAGCAIAGDAGDGAWSHTCIGVGDDLIDCHNAAFLKVAVKDMFKSVDAIVCP